MKIFHGMLCLSLCLPGFSVQAYKEPTHADISEQAVRVSFLNDPSKNVLSDLGLPSSINVDRQFPNSANVNQSILDLVRTGAVFEDGGARAANHFYDPINGAPLTFRGTTLGRISPDWALEDRGQITVNPAGRQDYSFADARWYLYLALTSNSVVDRKKFFGLTFQTLGQVMHHVQDMAQPQHVRNDLHLDVSLGGLTSIVGLYNPSLYEAWTNLDSVRPRLPYTGYAPTYSSVNSTTFNLARKFWTTPDKIGLADFTNRNFVSAGTNFDKPGIYPSPVLDESRRIDMDFQQLCGGANLACPNPNLRGTITFYGGNVSDGWTGETSQNPFTSSLSIFDADLRGYTGNPFGQPRLFTLNRFNFAAAHSYLIPRAVAYSAGLINYFFRGKLEVEGQGATQLLVKNVTKEAMKGDFELFYDDAKDNRYPVTITACSVGGVNVPVADGKCKGVALAAANPEPGMPLQVTFTPPVDPPQKVSGEYMVVFAGDLGEEKAGDGNVGAVVAKQIRTIGGALYISARDNLGRLVFLRADASGTMELTPGDGQFNPLISVSPQNLQKAYSMRQVRFVETGPGLHSYAPLALAVGNTLFGSRVTQSFVKNASTNTFDNNGIGESWLAKSPRPEVGEFTFRVVLTSPATGSLQYTRKYRGLDGNLASDTGTVALPSLRQRNMAPNYLGFGAGLLHVSADGLTVRGLRENVNPSTSTGIGVNYELVIRLDTIPAIELVEKSREPMVAAATVEPYSAQSLGPLSTTARCDPSAPTLTRSLVAEIYREKGEANQRQTMLIGYLNNTWASYQLISTSSRQITGERISGFVPTFGQGAACDAIGGWTRRQRRGIVHAQLQLESRAVFSDGELTYSRRILGIQDALGSNLRTMFGSDVNRSWDYSYEGGASLAPPFEFKNLEVSDVATGGNFSIVWALTDKLTDAIVKPVSSNLTTFRSIDITGKNYVADASPLGEVFFATTDLSIVIHEPKGSTPKMVIPPNVVQLLAAVWF